MIKYIKYILIFLLITTSVAVGGDYLLKVLQNKFNSINDLSADFVQLTNGKINLEGKFYFKKTNKLKLDLKNLLIISDGQTNWNYNKSQDKVIIGNYDENDPSALSLKKIIFDYPEKCTVSDFEESGARIIQLIPKKDSGINAEEITLWLNKEDLVKKIEIKANTGNLLEFRFSNYKTNSGIPDKEFSFNPHKGTKVIDLR